MSWKVSTREEHVSLINSKPFWNCCMTWKFIRKYRCLIVETWKWWWRETWARNFDYEILTPGIRGLIQVQWLRVAGESGVDRGQGVCYQWKAKEQCPIGDKCSVVLISRLFSVEHAIVGNEARAERIKFTIVLLMIGVFPFFSSIVQWCDQEPKAYFWNFSGTNGQNIKDMREGGFANSFVVPMTKTGKQQHLVAQTSLARRVRSGVDEVSTCAHRWDRRAAHKSHPRVVWISLGHLLPPSDFLLERFERSVNRPILEHGERTQLFAFFLLAIDLVSVGNITWVALCFTHVSGWTNIVL